MNELGFQTNYAQFLPQIKIPLRQRQMNQQDFQKHFQVAVSINEN
ncbi:hypothetical protein ACFQ9Y_07170 [Peribacillus simplex]